MISFGDENAFAGTFISVLKIETVQVQASLLPCQADVTAL